MARGRTPLPLSEQEQAFQDAYQRWEDSNYTDKQAWDIMWFRVRECCHSIAKKLCTGVYNPHLEDRADEAVCYYMNRIKRDKIRPRKLSSWCYLGTKGMLYKRKYQYEDAEMSFESYEKYEEIRKPDEVRGIVRLDMVNTNDVF